MIYASQAGAGIRIGIIMEKKMEKNKKTVHDFEFIGRIIEILRLLQEQTDEYTMISQAELLALMKEDEYPCSERTLADYLKVMMKELNPEEVDGFVEESFGLADYKIIPKGLEEKLAARDNGHEKEGAKKLQLRQLRYNHIFSFDELNQIAEAILFLKNIGTEEKECLIRKLQKLSSVNYPKYSPYISETTGKIYTDISGVFEESRVDEAVTRKNLGIIREAIAADHGAGHKIEFHFNGYNEKMELIPRRKANGELMTYVVSPYYVFLHNGKYYLVCSAEPYGKTDCYRIDLMTDITDKTKTSILNPEEKIPQTRKPKHMIKGLPLEWNDSVASEFQAQHLYMFYGEPCRIRLKLDRERYTLLHDYFGNHYTFRRHIDEHWDEVEVSCVPKAMEVWAMQCSDYVEVLSPMELREDIAEKCREVWERYR